jgi:hypothetical protein
MKAYFDTGFLSQPLNPIVGSGRHICGRDSQLSRTEEPCGPAFDLTIEFDLAKLKSAKLTPTQLVARRKWRRRAAEEEGFERRE